MLHGISSNLDVYRLVEKFAAFCRI